MSIAKLWANKVYSGVSIDLVPTEYLADVEIILEETRTKEDKDIWNYHITKKIEELDKENKDLKNKLENIKVSDDDLK